VGGVKNAHRHLVAIPPRKEQRERLWTVLKSDLNILLMDSLSSREVR